jgi:hypothetical protein
MTNSVLCEAPLEGVVDEPTDQQRNGDLDGDACQQQRGQPPQQTAVRAQVVVSKLR